MSCCETDTVVCTTIVYAQPVPETIVVACLPPLPNIEPLDMLVETSVGNPRLTVTAVEWDFTVNGLEVATAIDEVSLVNRVTMDVDGLEVATEIDELDLSLQQFFQTDDLEVTTVISRLTLAVPPQFNVESMLMTTVIDQVDLDITSFQSTPNDLSVATEIDEVDVLVAGTFQPLALQTTTEIDELDLVINQSFTANDMEVGTVIDQAYLVEAGFKGLLFDNGEGGIFDTDTGEAMLVIGTGDDMLLVGTGTDSLIIGAGGEGNAGWVSDGE